MSADIEPRGGQLARIAHGAVDRLAEDAGRPEWRAGLTVSMLTVAMLARTGLRAGPAIMIALTAGACAEHAYKMLIDVHKAAVASMESPDGAGKR